MRGSKMARFTWIKTAAGLRSGCLAGGIFVRTVNVSEKRDNLAHLTSTRQKQPRKERFEVGGWPSTPIKATHSCGITVNDVIEHFRLKELVDKGENGRAWATRDRYESYLNRWICASLGRRGIRFHQGSDCRRVAGGFEIRSELAAEEETSTFRRERCEAPQEESRNASAVSCQ